jgi:5-methylcytosine-specific restriction endonuclease McrA
VCKNCLRELGGYKTEGYKGYRFQADVERKKIHESFSIADFFDFYRKQNILIPRHTDATLPINNYTGDFHSIANKTKHNKNYTCESCQRKFDGEDRKFLHVHHKDFAKSNNNANNLKVLCIGCHAEQPGHAHIKGKFEYAEFMRKFDGFLF